MNKVKKTITMSLVAIVIATNALEANSDYQPYQPNRGNVGTKISSFEQGFSTAINAMERELTLTLSGLYLFEIDNNYIVYLDIGNMPREHILIAKNYMIKEGFFPITTKNMLIIDGVDRVVDAKNIIKQVKYKYFRNKNVKYKRNSTKVYKQYDHIFRDIVKSLKKHKCNDYKKMLESSKTSRF